MTGWSWKVGRVAGIDISMHATFLLLLAWVGLTHYLQRHRLADAGAGIVFVLVLFAVVVLHELSHALVARHFGARTREITLLPIGGVARMERMPETPKHEMLVALAGPAVNLALAALLAGVTTPTAWRDVDWIGGGDFLSRLLWVNVSLAVFNLIPAFPMDGGRVLRAALAMRMEPVRATAIAARFGQSVAIAFGLAGLFLGAPLLVFIAVFVWMGAAAEAGAAAMRSVFAGVPVSHAMVTRFETLMPADSLRAAVMHAVGGFQQDFPVVDDGEVVGVLTRTDLIKGLSKRGPAASVASVMTTKFAVVEASELLERAIERLQAADVPVMPVVRNGALVGLLTMENVAEVLMFTSALRDGAGAAFRTERSAAPVNTP